MDGWIEYVSIKFDQKLIFPYGVYVTLSDI